MAGYLSLWASAVYYNLNPADVFTVPHGSKDDGVFTLVPRIWVDQVWKFVYLFANLGWLPLGELPFISAGGRRTIASYLMRQQVRMARGSSQQRV